MGCAPDQYEPTVAHLKELPSQGQNLSTSLYLVWEEVSQEGVAEKEAEIQRVGNFTNSPDFFLKLR